MKLCYFLSDITNTGGIERVLSLLTTEQAKDSDCEVTIISKFKSFAQPNYIFSDRVKIVYLSKKPLHGAPASLLRLKNHFSILGVIRKFFLIYKYDLILSQAFPNTFTLWMAGVNMKKVIAVEHTYYAYYGSIIRNIRNWLYKKCSAVVVLTNRDKEYFDNSLTNVFVIPNPLELSCRRHALLEDGRIITVGRLEYAKAYDVLIKIFAEVHKVYPTWHLDIYGKGTLKDKLQNLIESLKLGDCVTLKGVTDKILDEMYHSSFYVMSSRFEGFAMVLVEAMSQGVPCVSFDCPNGPSTIIKDGENGLLIENQNEKELYNAIIKMICDRETRMLMGRKAYDSVVQYDVANIVKRWQDLCLKILNCS